jgi:VWFA-related protein
MKKSILMSGILALCIAAVSQDIQHEAVAVNIEVPVRVFDGETFIENLTKEDFEVRENGVVQVIEALYLIKKDRISREESDPGAAAGQAIAPEISRYFLLMFELSDWLPRLNEALEYFFDQVLLPQDSLAVVTPAQTYHFKQEAWTRLPKEKIFQQLKEKLRQDIVTGNIQYKSALKGIERLFTFAVPQDLKQIMYMDQVGFLQQLKVVDEKRMESLAEHLKGIPGQKHVFMFYQEEVVPVLPGLEDSYRPDLIKDIFFDENRIRSLFADSSISVHFLFISNKGMFGEISTMETIQPLRVELFDQSGQIYGAFREVAEATGGISDSSANPAFLFKKAAAAADNYYLLYYRPRDYRADGRFHRIEIKVKGRKYKVLHRAGYLAD